MTSYWDAALITPTHSADELPVPQIQGSCNTSRGGPASSTNPDVKGRLPEGWLEHTDDEGTLYYFHEETLRTTWTRPSNAAPPPPPPPGQGSSRRSDRAQSAGRKAELPPGWLEAADVDGNLYYYHELTAETSWSWPGADGASAGATATYDALAHLAQAPSVNTFTSAEPFAAHSSNNVWPSSQSDIAEKAHVPCNAQGDAESVPPRHVRSAAELCR